MHVKLQRSERFDEVVSQMDLSRAQDTVARRLGEGRSLSQLLKKYPNEATIHLIMVYILSEMDLLLAPLD